MKRLNEANFAQRQHGAVLVVVMILLLVMSLLGASSMRATLMQERMSASQLDRSLAFQAAEAALRQGELLAASKPAVTANSCSNGVCGIAAFDTSNNAPDQKQAWEVESNWNNAPTLTMTLENVSVAPKYLVELLANDVPARNSCTTSGDVSNSVCSGTESRYRVTARVQMDNRATVVLQSTYAVP